MHPSVETNDPDASFLYETLRRDTKEKLYPVITIYSCPKPIVSSTAIVNLVCSASRDLYAGRSSRLKLRKVSILYLSTEFKGLTRYETWVDY